MESPDDNEKNTAAPTNLSTAFKPFLAFPGKTKLLDIPIIATAIPKLPAFLKTLSVTVADPVVTLEKSRRVEALILRIQSKTERAIQQLKVFLDILDDVEN